MECVNTAIEIIVDIVSPKYNEAAGRAKDIAAGGVLACAIAPLWLEYLFFYQRLC